MDSKQPFHVLVLCTHNRTRSVMVGYLLRSLLADSNVEVATAGFGDSGRTAMPQAIQLLRQAGCEVYEHRSTAVTIEMVSKANLILVAEKKQVMAVVVDLEGNFDITFTLPEFATSSQHKVERPRGLAYLKADVSEVHDPTGRDEAVWRQVWNEIQQWCSIAARSIEESLK